MTYDSTVGAHNRPRILLLVGHREDRHLLAEYLGQSYEIRAVERPLDVTSNALIDHSSDLIITDGRCLEKHWEAIVRLKGSADEAFLPVLLVTSRRDVKYSTAELWRLVDEVILAPIEKMELRARTEILLRARRYSLRLKNRFYGLADLTPIAVIIFDVGCRIVYLNRRAHDVLHVGPEIVGQRLDELNWHLTDLDESLLPAAAWPVSRVLDAGDTVYDQRLAVTRADKRKVILSINAAPLSMSDSMLPDGVVMTLSDITQQIDYERGLRDARDRAEEMSRLKSVFLTNMSHEVRTPLTGILSGSEVIAAEATGELRELAQLVSESGARLMETLSSVLDLAQIESSSWIHSSAEIELNEWVRDVVDSFRETAKAAGIILRFNGTDCPIHIQIDVEALRRVVNSLLSNGLKFTKEGAVTVDLSSSDDEVLIKVCDTGIGISERFLGQVFDEFKQESVGHDRRFEGSGLGLTVAKGLVTLLGGDIDVQSEKGSGSVFTIRLPASDPHDGDTRTQSLRGARS